VLCWFPLISLASSLVCPGAGVLQGQLRRISRNLAKGAFPNFPVIPVTGEIFAPFDAAGFFVSLAINCFGGPNL